MSTYRRSEYNRQGLPMGDQGRIIVGIKADEIIAWMAGILLFLSVLSGIAIAEYPDGGDQMYSVDQGSGIAEPFYPAYPPSPDMLPLQNPTPLPSIVPGQQEYVSEPGLSFQSPQFSVDPVYYSDPVQSSNPNPGTAEPYYPSNPPSSAPYSSDEPIHIVPGETYLGPGTAVPYYPVYTQTPTPLPYTSPSYSSPVYYPSYRYQEPTVAYHWYDDRTYWPSYYDKYDRNRDYYYDNDYYSYVDGILKIASNPYQAEIYVDNKFRGYTPYSGYRTFNDFRPGTYTVRLKYSGYYDYYEDVYVSRGRTSSVDAEMIRIGETYQKSGSISIQSEPSGASVYLDNEYRGFSPVVLGEVKPGEHTLFIRKDGYGDYVSKVQVTDKQTIGLSAVLTRMSALTDNIQTRTPEQTPVPMPTKSGIFSGIVCIAVIMGCILIMQKKD